jgi:hypothetical protein
MAVNIHVVNSCIIAFYSLGGGYQCFIVPEDGGIIFLQDVDARLPNNSTVNT